MGENSRNIEGRVETTRPDTSANASAGMSVSRSVLLPILRTAGKQGVDENRLLHESGMDPALLDSADRRFSSDEYRRLLEKSIELTGDTTFGLRMGQEYNLGTANIVGYMMMNCRTLEQAFRKYIHYQRVVGEGNNAELVIEQSNAVLRLTATGKVTMSNRHILESLMVVMRANIEALTGHVPRLLEARFRHARPDDSSEYERIFQCPLKWEQPSAAIVFDAEQLGLPVKQPNQELLDMFEAHARTVLRDLDAHRFYSRKVSEAILAALDGDPPRIEDIAAGIPMSVRGLQLKLKAEGTGFQELLNDVRKVAAMAHLRDENLSIAQTAYLVGFAEPEAFRKAFKKWTGESPARFRGNASMGEK